jgi:3-oxoacyl-(acyl-carrier-protein) synthase
MSISITNIGWVLPAGTGSGPAALTDASLLPWQPEDNAALADFSAKPYLSSVKGYLDPAGSYCLAAFALALGEHDGSAEHNRSGIATVTLYGAPQSARKFHELLASKGPRFASPLVFPHGYANTAGNLAAIEFGFGGPHTVLQGRQDVREAIDFALTRLENGEADEMLVGAYEATDEIALPDNMSARNGAIAIRLATGDGLLALDRDTLWSIPAPDLGTGSVTALLSVLQALATA